MEKDEQAILKMQETYEEIFERLRTLVASEIISEYDRLAINAMCEKVALALARKYQHVKEGVKDVMGGQILEYEAKTILKKGNRTRNGDDLFKSNPSIVSKYGYVHRGCHVRVGYF